MADDWNRGPGRRGTRAGNQKFKELKKEGLPDWTIDAGGDGAARKGHTNEKNRDIKQDKAKPKKKMIRRAKSKDRKAKRKAKRTDRKAKRKAKKSAKKKSTRRPFKNWKTGKKGRPKNMRH